MSPSPFGDALLPRACNRFLPLPPPACEQGLGIDSNLAFTTLMRLVLATTIPRCQHTCEPTSCGTRWVPGRGVNDPAWAGCGATSEAKRGGRSRPDISSGCVSVERSGGTERRLAFGTGALQGTPAPALAAWTVADQEEETHRLTSASGSATGRRTLPRPSSSLPSTWVDFGEVVELSVATHSRRANRLCARAPVAGVSPVGTALCAALSVFRPNGPAARGHGSFPTVRGAKRPLDR
jgi:hypothetical protein